MNRGDLMRQFREGGIPRASGDEPRQRFCEEYVIEYSPRERG